MLAIEQLILSFLLFFTPVLGSDQLKYAAHAQSVTYTIAKQLGLFETWDLNTWTNGGYDILSGNIDDALDYRFNANLSVSVIGQLGGGPGLVLAAVPDITSVAQLKGKTLMVDSVYSGSTYVLRKVLSWHGLWLDNHDYSFQVVNSTSEAYQSLMTGSTPNGTAAIAAILADPYSAAGEAATPPLNDLIRISDFVNPLASTAFIVSRDRLAQNVTRDTDSRFLAAMMAANEFLAKPENAAVVVQTLSEQLSVSQRIAEAQYYAAIAPGTGETISQSTFAVNCQDLLNVMDIRGQFSGFNPVLSHFNFAEAIVAGPGKFIDDSIRTAAMNMMKR